MPVALILDFPGGSRAQYDQVVAQMDLGGHLPPGGLFHAAGGYQDGWRVVDVWQDLPTFEHFRDEQIIPSITEAGMRPPEVRIIEVRNERPASGRAPRFLQVVNVPAADEATFHEIDARVLPDDRVPDAMTFHVNGPSEGGWVVIDAWDSKDARDRFAAENILPAFEGSGVAPPTIEDLPVEATLAAGARATA